MMPILKIHFLGQFLLRVNDQPLTGVITPRAQELLAYLVLQRPAPVLRQTLAFLIWPDSTEAQAQTNLRKLIHQLRIAFPDADRFLHLDGPALQWQPNAPISIDIDEFDEACRAADQAEAADDPAQCRVALQRAVDLYRGELLPAVYAEWALAERERLRRLFFKTVERLVLLLERTRDYPAAIAQAQRLLHEDSLHEATYRYLMRLHLLNDDRSGALHTYHTCVTVLQNELGVAPSAATRQEYERLLTVEVVPGRPATQFNRAGAAETPTLVGRQAEWAALHNAWQTALDGKPGMVLLRGEGGIGKTRLAEELAGWVGRQGISTSRARCYAVERGLAYAPAVTWLRDAPLPPLSAAWRRELIPLLPELADRPEDAAALGVPTAEHRQRLLDALARALLASQPRLCVIDDLQWCDRETLEWLHYLLHFEPRAQLLVVGTARTEELQPGHPVEELLVSLRRDNALVEIELEPLDPEETALLAQHITTQALAPRLSSLLYQETEGNPLFVVEMLRAGLIRVSPRATRGLERGTPALPPSVQAVLTARFAQLSPGAQEIVALAATIGRAFTVPVLAHASDADEVTLINALDELWQRRVIREQGVDCYDFSHDKLRELAYRSLSPARRRSLHRRVAEALCAVYSRDLATVSGQIALHYEQGGRPDEALVYYLRAAETALTVYANEVAIDAYRRGIGLLAVAETRAAPAYSIVAYRLHEGLGDVLALTRQVREAEEAYRSALGSVPAGDTIARARLHRKTGTLLRDGEGDAEAALACDRAERELGPQPADPPAAWWQEWVEIQLLRLTLLSAPDQIPAMTALAERLRPIVEQQAAPLQQARFALRLVGLDESRDHAGIADQTLSKAEAALAALSDSTNLREMTDARFLLGCGLLWRGELARAEEQLQTALALSGQTGDLSAQVLCLTFLSLVYRKNRQTDAVRDCSMRILATGAAAGMPVSMAMAQANLAWLAWRAGDFAEAERQGRAALAKWPAGYPVQWPVRWPLLAVAVARRRATEALAHARALIHPPQYALPQALCASLTAGVDAGAAGQTDRALSHLEHALEQARQLRYL